MKWKIFKKNLRALRILFPLYLRSFFRPVPLWVHLVVTRRCNLTCSYCFIKDQTKDLKTEEMKTIIDRLHYLGVRWVAFFGGEPTLRKDLAELVSYAHGKGMVTHLSTNGILLAKDYIDRLGEAGIDMIFTSVDSVMEFDDSKKDYVRCKETLDLLLEGKKKYGFHVDVNLAFTNKNAERAAETVKLMNSMGLATSICFIVENTYSAKVQDKGLFFRSEQEKESLYGVLDEIIDLKKKGYRVMEPIQYFRDIKKFVNGETGFWDCHAGNYTFSVDYNGKLLVCTGQAPEEISIFDIDRNYYDKTQKLAEEKMARGCKEICLVNCMYDTSYYLRRPLHLIADFFH